MLIYHMKTYVPFEIKYFMSDFEMNVGVKKVVKMTLYHKMVSIPPLPQVTSIPLPSTRLNSS
jgi:hypothetical protein